MKGFMQSHLVSGVAPVSSNVDRKAVTAENHGRHTLLRKCFTAWELYVEQEQRERSIITEQEATKTKMASFLEAAATGK